MTQIVSIHSYRRGTGKSVLTVNLAVLLAQAGKKVGIIDAALQAPSSQFLFKLGKVKGYFFNDYLEERCEIEQALHDVTLSIGAKLPGRIYLVPANANFKSSISTETSIPIERLEEGIFKLIEELSLDVVLIDTSAGMKDDALLPLVVSDVVVEVLRLDQQDYQGTAVIADIVEKLGIPRVLLIANIVSNSHDQAAVKKEIEDSYQYEVAGILPVSEEMLALPDGAIFVLRFPKHPITQTLQSLANEIA